MAVPLRIIGVSEHVEINRSPEVSPRGRVTVTLKLSRCVTRTEQQTFKRRGYRSYGWFLEIPAGSVAEIDRRKSELKWLVSDVEQQAAGEATRRADELRTRQDAESREQREADDAVRDLHFG